MDNVTATPIEWVIRTKKGIGLGCVRNYYSNHFRALPIYGKPQTFDTLEDAVKHLIDSI